MTDVRFKERMKSLLGDGCEAFFAALEREAVRGARINPIKCKNPELLDSAGLTLDAISYVKDGYIMRTGEGVGATPEHHAGMIYVQDPGAMATVNALTVERGFRVLDACAAPGGKSSQLAEKIGDEGLLVSNEYVGKRAKIIVSNFERLGIKNALVLSQDTAKYKEMFEIMLYITSYFFKRNLRDKTLI